MQDPEVLVMVELLAIGRCKLPTEDPQLPTTLGYHHSLMSTAPGRWARDVNFCPGVLSDTVDVEFIIHEGFLAIEIFTSEKDQLIFLRMSRQGGV